MKINNRRSIIKYPKLLVISFVIVLWVGILTFVSLAASVTTGVTGLTAENSGGSWSGGSGAISGSISPSESSSCTGTSYSQATSTLTLKNNSGSQALLSFDYNVAVGTKGSATVDGVGVS